MWIDIAIAFGGLALLGVIGYFVGEWDLKRTREQAREARLSRRPPG